MVDIVRVLFVLSNLYSTTIYTRGLVLCIREVMVCFLRTGLLGLPGLQDKQFGQQPYCVLLCGGHFREGISTEMYCCIGTRHTHINSQHLQL